MHMHTHTYQTHTFTYTYVYTYINECYKNEIIITPSFSQVCQMQKRENNKRLYEINRLTFKNLSSYVKLNLIASMKMKKFRE